MSGWYISNYNDCHCYVVQNDELFLDSLIVRTGLTKRAFVSGQPHGDFDCTAVRALYTFTISLCQPPICVICVG